MQASVLQEAFGDDAFVSGTTITSAALGAFATIGSTLEAWVTCSNFGTAPTVQDSAGQSYTLKSSVFDASHGDQALHLFVFPNNASTLKLTATATYGAAQTGKGIWLKEIGGVVAASYDNCHLDIINAPGTGTDAVAGTAVSPTLSPVLCSALVMEALIGDGRDIAAGTGYTLGASGFTFGGNVLAKSESKRLASVTSTAATATAATNGASGVYLVGLAMYDESNRIATLDFGTGANEASVNVVGCASILTTSTVELFLMADDTTVDHTAQDHRYVGLWLDLSSGTPTAGVGFTIVGRSKERLQGKYNVRWWYKV